VDGLNKFQVSIAFGGNFGHVSLNPERGVSVALLEFFKFLCVIDIRLIEGENGCYLKKLLVLDIACLVEDENWGFVEDTEGIVPAVICLPFDAALVGIEYSDSPGSTSVLKGFVQRPGGPSGSEEEPTAAHFFPGHP
jgi:hypothetical protein